jgi:hypothetical protein
MVALDHWAVLVSWTLCSRHQTHQCLGRGCVRSDASLCQMLGSLCMQPMLPVLPLLDSAGCTEDWKLCRQLLLVCVMCYTQ